VRWASAAGVARGIHLGLARASSPAVLTLAARSGWTLRKLTDAYIRLVLEVRSNVAGPLGLGVAQRRSRGHA
jgi:hypothetical protein